MILVGNQRGGAKDLARHLMKNENERVTIHDLRGFTSSTLAGAFQESYAISRGTRCKQHLYSLSLNPPKEAHVGPEVFEEAIRRIEERLGLSGQPRAIVFHEKKGLDGEMRRHAHAVWCRIDADQMRAVQLSFTKRKLQEIGRDLYLEHDWQMPRGFVRSSEANPRTYTLAEWQQAKRSKRDPEKLKAIFQDCWAISDSQGSFAHALEERGFILACGDRRGVVAVDRDGEVFAIPRWVGVKTAQVKKRVTAPGTLPNTRDAHSKAANILVARLAELESEQRQQGERSIASAVAAAQRQREFHQRDMERLEAVQARRAEAEATFRSSRIRTGWRGLIDFITGKRRRVEEFNRLEALKAQRRDHEERRIADNRQIVDRENIAHRISTERSRLDQVLSELRDDIEARRIPGAEDSELEKVEIKRTRRKTKERPRRRRSREGP